jgi:flagellin-like protein
MKIPGQQRKAISPIVATVLIIAATLIAAAAILGYVFGIFGSASNTANVTAASPSVSHLINSESAYPATAATYGTLTLTNSGTAATSVSSGTITFGGTTYQLLVGSSATAACTSATCTVPSGGTFTLYFYYNGGSTPPTISPGQAFNGVINLANAEQATFTGTFS